MKIICLIQKKSTLFISILFFSITVHAQIPLQRQFSTALTGDFPATQSITLLPGFSTSGPFRAYIVSGADQPLVSLPSQNQNYILTNTVKKAGITDASGLSGLSVSEMNQSVAYFDGLGRPLQTVMVQASPNFADMVQPFAYDAFGREEKKYGVYSATTTGGAYRADALASGAGLSAFYSSAQAGMISTAFPFSQTVFESSPLNRVIEQGAPGVTWQPVAGSAAGHTVKVSYGTNNSDITYPGTTGYGVRLYRADVVTTAGHEHERTLATETIYGAGQLYLTITYDENWTGTGKAGTTEEYKDKEGHVVLKRNFGLSGTATDVLSTYYVYDDFGNLSYVLTPKVTPDVPTVTADLLNKFCYQYRYDGRNRLIEKKVPGTDGWTRMIYNQLDQLVLSQDTVQALTSSSGPYRSFIKYDALGRIIMTGVESGHTLDRATVQNVVANYPYNWDTRDNNTGNYHGYNNLSAPNNSLTMDVEIVNYYDDYNIPGLPIYPSSGFSVRTKGLLTAMKVKVMGTSGVFLWTVNYYDDEGRLVKQYKQHYLSGAANAANYDEFSNSYNFASELTATTRIHHVGATVTTIASRYTYDQMGRKLITWESVNGAAEIALSKLEYNETGQLLKKYLHSTDQGTTFLQNSSYVYNERGWLKTTNSAQFSFELRYQDGTTPQYNGNISNQLWGAGGNNPNKFTYTYDKLDRLRSGVSTGIVMNEAVSYDAMGNITTLNREGVQGTYSYTGNRLNSVSGGTLATGTYSYNANGSATTDGRTGVVLTYNHLNLPVTATKTGLALSYIYDATGNKLRKTSNGVVRHYIDGIEYNGSTLEIIHTEEGLIRKSGTTYSYEYNLTDHLGNARYSFYKNPETNAITKLAETNYYPFGKAAVVLQGNNKYLYNGKELQDELGQLDYGARFYDPVIARWNVVDPMAEKMMTWSPYTYAFNNPIRFIDVGGEYPWPVQIRSFISTSTTGGGLFRGDGRGASFSGTSRVRSSFTVDPSARSVSQPITRSDPTVFYGLRNPTPGGVSLPPAVKTGSPEGTNDNISFSGDKASFDFSHSGKDPLTPGFATPALDVHASLSFNEDMKNGVLTITGSFTGDKFPSTEAFVTDQSGKTKLFLGAQMENGGIGDLYGDNKKPLFNVNMQVKFDGKGNFTGVQVGKASYTVAEWNKKVQEDFKK